MPSTHLLTTLLLAAPILSIPVQHQLLHPRDDTIPWTNCSDRWWLPQNLDCAYLELPIDWSAPDTSPKFSLSLVRLPRKSNSTASRIGPLFINPGGPGGRAIVTVAEIARGFREIDNELLERFDIIGVDPRGVGESAPELGSYCDIDIYNERVSLFPKTQEEYDALVDKNRRLGESCLSKTGELVNHLDTISAARDHEAVRKGLGEDMNWLGLSYGSMIGAQYAALYPENIRAMVFDGMVQHSQSEATNILIESTAYSVALTSFFTWASTNSASPLKDQDVEKLWYSIVQKATESPIPAPEHAENEGYRHDVRADEFLLNAQGFLISASEQSRIRFAEALKKASEGDASAFATPLEYLGSDDLFPPITIACQDWAPANPSFASLSSKMRMAETFSPLNKGASQSYTVQASCIGWPAPLNNPPKKLDVKTKNPILVVNALKDPSTSYAWATGMMEELENAVLLTRDGDGHTSWYVDNAKETTQAINRYLLTGEVPAAGTVLDG